MLHVWHPSTYIFVGGSRFFGGGGVKVGVWFFQGVWGSRARVGFRLPVEPGEGVQHMEISFEPDKGKRDLLLVADRRFSGARLGRAMPCTPRGTIVW